MGQTLSFQSSTPKTVRSISCALSEILADGRLDRDAMDYFRAIAAVEERSERALELTETIIRKNPAHYTVW